MAQGTRRLAAVMFTDIVGYSELTQRDEALSLELLEFHNDLVRAVLPAHHGVEVKTIGDAFMVEFRSALGATLCAVALQAQLHEYNATVDERRRLVIRIGLHVGDVVEQGGDLFGDGVNIAARIEPLSLPGGVALNEDVARQVQNKLGLDLVSLGPRQLKNIAQPHQVYRVVLPWEDAPTVAEQEPEPARRKEWRPAGLLLTVLLALVLHYGPMLWRLGRSPATRQLQAAATQTTRARLAITSNPPGAEFWVNGELHTGPVIECEPGTIEVQARLAGYRWLTRQLTVQAGVEYQQVFTLEPTVLSGPSSDQTNPPTSTTSQRFPVWAL